MASNPQTFTGADVSLFHIAMQRLKDPLQWYRFMQANNLTDYVITGTVSLVVPEIDPTASGGVPPR